MFRVLGITKYPLPENYKVEVEGTEQYSYELTVLIEDKFFYITFFTRTWIADFKTVSHCWMQLSSEEKGLKGPDYTAKEDVTLRFGMDLLLEDEFQLNWIKFSKVGGESEELNYPHGFVKIVV